jgi:hypothetical protein
MTARRCASASGLDCKLAARTSTGLCHRNAASEEDEQFDEYFHRNFLWPYA